MLFHFRIRGLSGIIESVVPCSHGQTLNRTVVDLHRHQLRFFLAALEHKGEDQHDCHKHEAEHIAVARTVHEALRGIGTATGRIAGLAQAQQAGQVIPVGEDLPKSFLLCRDKGGKVKVYLSQLSTATLLKRMELGSLTI